MLHRFHQKTGGFRIVQAIEVWWRMPVHVKEHLAGKWAKEDAAKVKEKKHEQL
jgi:hypothetical protein